MNKQDTKNDSEIDINDCTEDKNGNDNDISDVKAITNSSTRATKNGDKMAKLPGTNTTTPTRTTAMMTTVAKTT